MVVVWLNGKGVTTFKDIWNLLYFSFCTKKIFFSNFVSLQENVEFLNIRGSGVKFGILFPLLKQQQEICDKWGMTSYISLWLISGHHWYLVCSLSHQRLCGCYKS